MIRRRLFNIAAVLSICAFFATIVLMVRSSIVCDSVRAIHIDTFSGHLASVDSLVLGNGIIAIGHEYDTYQKAPATRTDWEVEQNLPWRQVRLFYDCPSVRPWVGWSWANMGLGRTSYVAMPLLIPAGLFAIVPLMALASTVRKRVRLKQGACRQCGYNLTGNTSGVCPECGTPISSKPEAIA